jgi:hypothetical protein
MNSYIELDGECYKTVAKKWSPPLSQKAMSIRNCLDGTLDVTYGPGVNTVFAGDIEAPVTAPTDPPAVGKTWGTRGELQTSLDKLEGLDFVDHEGNSYTVHVKLTKVSSLTPVWDGTSNIVYFSVVLVA